MDGWHATSNSEIQNSLRLILIAYDTDYKLWPKSMVDRAQERLAGLNGIPRYETLCQSLGKERVDVTFTAIIQQRREELRFHAALQAVGDPCHLCGATEKLNYHDFGLACVTEQAPDWKPAMISAALSSVSLPFVGLSALFGPGKTRTRDVLKMRLALCEACEDQRRGSIGRFSVREQDGKAHPLWNYLREAGFTKFLSAGELTYGSQTRPHITSAAHPDDGRAALFLDVSQGHVNA